MKKPTAVKPERNMVRTLFYISVPIWLVVLTLYVTSIVYGLNGSARLDGQNVLDLHFRLTRLEFCVNNSIKPCDDEDIKKLNATLSEDERFSLVRPLIQ